MTKIVGQNSPQCDPPPCTGPYETKVIRFTQFADIFLHKKSIWFVCPALVSIYLRVGEEGLSEGATSTLNE